MKRIIWTSLFAVALTLSAPAALYTYNYTTGFQNGGVIPDGSADGWTDTRTVSGLSGVIGDVNVCVNTSGGVNGDLYAYLRFNNGSVVLLNRIGKTADNPFASSTAGFGNGGVLTSFRFDDSATTDIHNVPGTAGSPVTGDYQPDGRTADPQIVLDTSARSTSLASFNNVSPNGDWSLFFSDTVGGNGSPTMLGWSLEITAVPEPVNVALGVFGGVFLVGIVARSRWVRDLFRRSRTADVQ